MQVTIAAGVAVAGIMILRRTRLGRIDNTEKSNISFDTGQNVHVDTWHKDGTARVSYRGTQWDAETETPDTPHNVPLYIREIRGNRLILTARRPGA